MADKIKLTKDRVNKLLIDHQYSMRVAGEKSEKYPAQRDVYDTELKGFLVRLGKTKAVYCVAKRCNGIMTRVVIGDHGLFLPEHNDPKLNARKRAAIIVADMESGVDPNKAKQERKIQGATLSEAYENYLVENPRLKPRTIKEYSSLLRNHANDWMDKPLKDLTSVMVEKRHRETTVKGGAAQANKLVRTLRAICNQNKALLTENPACMPRKKWNPSVRRTGLIQAHQLPAWYLAIIDYPNQDTADYLFLLLLTGLRRSEGFSLFWKDVDLKDKTLIARDTKNGKDHTMPLSDTLCEMLERRKENAVNDFVFPSLTSASGHLVEPKKAVASIAKTSGIPFILHDLRRTFISAANSLGIAPVLVKRLVNHSTSDVTEGYGFEIEQTGPANKMQEITDTIIGFIARPAAVILALKLLSDQSAKQAGKIVNLDDHRRVAA